MELKSLRGMLDDLVFLQSRIQWLGISLSEYRKVSLGSCVFSLSVKLTGRVRSSGGKGKEKPFPPDFPAVPFN